MKDTKIEGIVIRKTPFKERDLICQLLTRDGKKINVLFYGGQGGGKMKKSCILELGFMIKAHLSRNKKGVQSSTESSSDWQLLWEHEHIRFDFQIFSLLTFYLELIDKISTGSELESPELFILLSNAIFQLDKETQEKVADVHKHLNIFLIKLIFHLGVGPNTTQCILCEKNILEEKFLELNFQQGGFTCSTCLQNLKMHTNSINIHQAIAPVIEKKYSEISTMPILEKEDAARLFQFFCYQFDFEPESFRTKSYLI